MEHISSWSMMTIAKKKTDSVLEASREAGKGKVVLCFN
jgi:hypothetical protein